MDGLIKVKQVAQRTDTAYKASNSALKNQNVKDIFPPGAIDSSARLIFANALHFKGAWDQKFDASQTKEHEFHLLNGSTIKAAFMTSKKKQFLRVYDDFKVLSLSYKQGEDKRRFSMYFFLPDAKDGLDKVGSQPEFLERHLPSTKVEVGEFRIQKFKVSFGFEAQKTLKDLGLVLPFSDGGLTEMVVVSNIFHKSFIEVDEEGTEAAAATAAHWIPYPYDSVDLLS